MVVAKKSGRRRHAKNAPLASQQPSFRGENAGRFKRDGTVRKTHHKRGKTLRMDEILVLIAEKPKIQDANGIWRGDETRKTVFCLTHDITRAEFFGAGRNGLNPENMVTVFAGDYNNERICELKGERFNIYRTFTAQNSDYVELYLERTAGTN